MSSLLTKNFSILMSKQILNLLDVSANSYLPANKKSYMYVFLAKQNPWNNGTETVPTPKEDINSTNDYFKRGILAKRLSQENASLVAPRINWTANTVYNTYEANTNFYVLNTKDQVFKCLSNAAPFGTTTGISSTTEPEILLSSTSLEEPFIKTADGYKWKYLYTLTSQQKQKFLSQEWMPVTENKFVKAAAKSSSIDIIKVTNKGNNYTDGSTQSIITVDGDGSGAILKANVVSGNVVDVIIQSRGQNYTFANVIFTDVTGGIGSGAEASISISPVGGHGFDPVHELGASTIMFDVDFIENEADRLPVDNDFREIVLLHNPYIYGTNNLATSEIYSLYTKVRVSPGVGNFINDEKVIQGSTLNPSFSADVISFDSVNRDLYLNNVKGTLINNQTITGLTSSSQRVVNSFETPSLKLYSGKVLYISDRLPITRDSAQTERIRFILSF